MGSYDVKRGHHKTVEPSGLAKLLQAAFGNAKDRGGGKVEAQLGPLVVAAWYEGGGKVLKFESNTPTQVDDETATRIVRARNQFLEAATGFNAKERAKRAKKAVTAAGE
ncbi:MAG TPA: DUF5611 family protein [Candidatus Thermoplasmatota archaeon]